MEKTDQMKKSLDIASDLLKSPLLTIPDGTMKIVDGGRAKISFGGEWKEITVSAPNKEFNYHKLYMQKLEYTTKSNQKSKSVVPIMKFIEGE